MFDTVGEPAVGFVRSTAPLSQCGPWGRGTPRWSVDGQAASTPASIGGLATAGSWVSVGAPRPSASRVPPRRPEDTQAARLCPPAPLMANSHLAIPTPRFDAIATPPRAENGGRRVASAETGTAAHQPTRLLLAAGVEGARVAQPSDASRGSHMPGSHQPVAGRPRLRLVVSDRTFPVARAGVADRGRFMRLAADIGRAPLWFCSSVSAGRLRLSVSETSYVCAPNAQPSPGGGARAAQTASTSAARR